MSRTLLTLLVGLSLSSFALAQTIVSGNVQGVWTAAQSPYRVAATARVAAGASLVIEPGVLVRFDDGTGLEVEGALSVGGATGPLVVFTTSRGVPAPSAWTGLLIRGAAANARLINVEIAFTHYGLQTDRAGGEFERVLIHHAGYVGIWVNNAGAPTFRHCSVVQCVRPGAPPLGIFVDDDLAPLFENCLIAGNGGEGLYCSDRARPVLKQVELRDNGGNGLVLSPGAQPSLIQCNIFGNGSFDLAVRDAIPKGPEVQATQVWWGGTDSAWIETRILHEPDGGTRAKVVYQPVAAHAHLIGAPIATPSASPTPTHTGTPTPRPGDDPQAPRWANQARQLMFRIHDSFRETIAQQDEQGSYSAGTDPDNDVEKIPPFNGFYLITHDRFSVDSAIKAADWLWNVKLHRGYDRGMNECHHGGELSWNCYPFTMTHYGDQKWIDRVNTMSELAPTMTAMTAGRRHFKSFMWNGYGQFQTNNWKGVDLPENARYMPAWNYALWLNPEHTVPGGMKMRDLLRQHGDAWHQLAMSTAPNKPYGVFPYEVVFETGQVAGYSNRWWAMKASLTKPASDFNWDWRYGMVAPRALYFQMLSNYLITGSSKYLEPIDETIRFFFRDQAINGIPASYMNIFRNEDDATGEFPAVNSWGNLFTDMLAALWRRITDNPKYDAEFKRYADLTLEYWSDRTDNWHLIDRSTMQWVRDSRSFLVDPPPASPLFLGWTATGDKTYLEKALEWTPPHWGLSYLLLMYTGGYSPAEIIYPHNLFSWENVNYNHAALIVEQRKDYARMLVYNFEPTTLEAKLRVWELQPGAYRLRRGPDADRDDRMDNVAEERVLPAVLRASLIDLPLPPRTLQVVELERLPPTDGFIKLQ